MQSNLLMLSIVILTSSSALGRDQPPISLQEALRVKQIYRQAAEKLNALEERPGLSSELQEDEIEAVAPRKAEPPQIGTAVMGNLGLRLDRTTFDIKFLQNDRLATGFHDARQQTTRVRRGNGLIERSHYHDLLPMALTPGGAVARAQDYLVLFGMEIPTNYRLVQVAFGKRVSSRWNVEWESYHEGIPFKDFIVSTPTIAACFHETKGFVSLERTSEAPPSRPGEIQVTRDEAIIKAMSVAQFVEKSPHYLRHREPGFVPCAIREVKLAVAVPNWLLDPKRAIWLRDKPPEETRICWLVQILTRAGTEDLAKRRLLPPQVTIMIDAKTGETAGANFS